MELEEPHFLDDYHANIEKEWKKNYPTRHMKQKHFNEGDKILLYDSKFMKHL